MWLSKPYFKLSQPFFQELESVKFLFSFLFLMGPFARHLLTKYLHLILAFIKHWKNLLFLWENIICIFRRKRHFLRVNLKNILYETVFEKIPPPPLGLIRHSRFVSFFQFKTFIHLLFVFLVISQYYSIALIEACFV